MSSAVISVAGGRLVAVRLVRADEPTTTVAGKTETAEAAADDGTHSATVEKEPSPLEVDPKELFWGLGAFLVLLALMRFVFYPRVGGAMNARSAHITQTLADADGIRDAAQSDVSAYDAKLTEIKAEAAARVDAARQTVEAERQTRLTEVNARIGTLRASALAEAEAARASVSGQVTDAAGDVVSTISRMVLGKTPDDSAVRTAVSAAMGSN